MKTAGSHIVVLVDVQQTRRYCGNIGSIACPGVHVCIAESPADGKLQSIYHEEYSGELFANEWLLSVELIDKNFVIRDSFD